MNVSPLVIDYLSLFAWREGRRLSPGCRPAALGIAHVIRNRVDSGWLSSDWLKIMNEIPVHSAENIAEMDWMTLPDVSDKDFQWIHSEVTRLYQDRMYPDTITVSADTTWASHRANTTRPGRPKGLYYCCLQRPIRQWFLDNIIHRPLDHPRTAESGTITFYA